MSPNEVLRQQALDRVNAMLAQLEAERPARERRQAQESASALPQDPPELPATPAPPVRPAAAERRGRRDWEAERRWIDSLINRKVTGDLVEGIGLALAEHRRELEATFEKRLEAVRIELRQMVATALIDLRREMTTGVFSRGIAESLQRLDDLLSKREELAWPHTIDVKPN